jgi:hypothetical protein
MAVNENLLTTFPGYYKKFVTPPGTGWETVYNFTGVSFQRVVTISSVKTPGFKNLKKRLRPINNYSKTIDVTYDPPFTRIEVTGTQFLDPAHGWYRIEKRDIYHNTESYGGSPGLTALATPEDPTQRAITNLLNTLGEGKTNSLVSLAEISKTGAMVAKTATRLHNAIKALKKGEFEKFTSSLGITATRRTKRRFDKRYNEAKSKASQDHRWSERSRYDKHAESRITDFAADTMLEFSYGWKPLLHDVYSHAKALAEISIERSPVVRQATGRAKTEKISARRYANAPNNYYDFYKVTDFKRFAEVGVSYRLPVGGPTAFHQLGINNPLEVAWEVVPFSFIVDWFLPVGEFLRNLTATSGLIFESGYISKRDILKVELSTFVNGYKAINPGIGYATALSGSGRATREFLSITRTKIFAFPSPSFPGFKDPRSTADGGVNRAFNAIALLQTLFLRGGK